MNILLAGPFLTEGLRAASGLKFLGAPGGYAQTPLVPLAAELHERGHHVHVVTLDPRVRQTEDHYEQRLRLTFCPLRAPPQYRTRVRALDLFKQEISQLVEVMASSDADILHAHWTYEYAEAAVRVKSKSHLVTMHDLGWDYLFHFRDAYRFMRLLMKYRVMHKIRNLSVVSPFMAKKAKSYGYFGNVHIIPNSITMPDLKEPRSAALDTPIFVTIGNRGRVKNVMASVEAFSHIRKSIGGAQLHLFGDGLDEQFAVGPGIFAHGATSHPKLMEFLQKQATLLIHPARLETFGVIIAEAKARGVPVVAGERSGGAAYVCGTEGGVLVDIENPNAIARAALDFVKDRTMYEEASGKAIEDVRARFDVRVVADGYLKLYGAITSEADIARFSGCPA